MRGTTRSVARCCAAVSLLSAVLGASLVRESAAFALDPTKTLAQYVTHHWKQSDDGLPQNSVSSMIQGRDGYLWLATQEGLVRFDGVRFVVTRTRDVAAIGTNDIDAVAEDASGALWLGTRGAGVVRYANGELTRFGTKEGLAHDVVLSLRFTRDGALWVGTRGGGVSRLLNGSFTTFRASDGLASDTVWAIDELPDGALAFGTDAGLSILRAGRLVGVPDLSASHVHALLADADGTLWVGSSAGLARVRNGEVTSLQVGGPEDAVLSLLRDRDGNLWVGTQTGVRRLSSAPGSPGKATPLGALSTLDWDPAHPFEARSFLADREGNLWVGTQSEGLLRLRDGKVTTFGTSFVWATYEAPDQTIWLATESGVASRQGDALMAIAPPVPMVVYGLSPAYDAGSPNGMWLSTQSLGIFHFDGTRFAKWTGDPALANATVDVTYEAVDGSMWIGTQHGIEHVSGTTVRHFGPADNMPETEVDAIVPAADGSLWVGGRAGLGHWKDGAFTLLTTKDGLANDYVQTILVDGDDVWMGTNEGGLNLLHAGKIGHVTTANGLSNDVVFTIVDDQRGDLWMTCNRGIFHARKAELRDVAMGARDRVTSTALSTSDGMKSSECNSGMPAGIRAHDGTLWFSTNEGVVRVDPAHMRMNTVVPPVRVEEMSVDRAPVDLRAAKHALPADSRDFQFEYTALSFTAPERVRFKYRLEGFDRDWVDAGARRVAYYTNLSPGSYRFRVMAANDDGVWNEEGAEVAFSLAPHLYQTIPFYLVCVLGLMFLGSVSVRWRLLALREQARALEQKVEERTSELARVNTDLAGAFKALAEKDARVHEDLLEAQAFQQRILPKLPSGGPIRFRALYRPAGLVGGDIYDIYEVKPGHYRVFVADTTGHGVQASLRTMVLKTEYDRVKLSAEGPAHVLAELNREIVTVYPDLELRCSGCCFDVVADRDGGARLVYANAAHPPLLRVTQGRVEEIYSPGTFLGVVLDVPFREVEAYLAAGDKLLVYTDGLYEQEDAGGQPFGMERMTALLVDPRLDAEAIVRRLGDAVTAFSAGRALADDLLLVCLECAGDRRSRADL